MDMYGGNPPKYYLAGMLNTPRMKSYTSDAWNYFYRSLISVMMVAQAFRQQALLKELYSFRDFFEEQSGKTKWESPEKLIKKEKNKKAQQKNQGDGD